MREGAIIWGDSSGLTNCLIYVQMWLLGKLEFGFILGGCFRLSRADAG